MRLSDFFAGWTGDGFGGLCDHEAHFEDAPDCDHVDDVCLAFAERARPVVIVATATRRSCAVCGGDLASDAKASTCSRSCASALGHASPPMTAGVVLGLLTAIRYVESGNGQVWEFRCACGNTTTRLSTEVRAAVRSGRRPACATCANARRGVGSLTSAEILAAAERNHRAWSRRARKA